MSGVRPWPWSRALARRCRGDGGGVAGGSATGSAAEDGAAVEAAMAAVIEAEPLVELDYVACVQADSLEPVGRLYPDGAAPATRRRAGGPGTSHRQPRPMTPLPPLLAGHQTVR